MSNLLLLGAGGGSATAPTLSSAAIGTNGTSLTMTFSEAVTGFASGAEGFALTGLSGGSTTLTYASGNGSTSVVMTVSRTVASGETGGSLAYTAGDITAVATSVALANFSGTSVTNNSTQTAPTLSSAAIGTNGTSLTLTFSASVTGFASGAEGFALTGLSGGATTLTYASGNGTSSVVMTVSRTVSQGETGGSLAYTAGDITASGNGLSLANFSGTSVTNNSTVPAPANTVAPVVSGTETEDQTLTSTTGTWTGSATITYTYQWQRNNGGWANIGSATNSTYVLQAADVGYPVRCVVTGTNGVGSASANSNATGNIKAVPSVRNDTSGGLTASTAITLPASSSGDQVAVMVAGAASLPTATAGWTRQWNTPVGSGAPYLALYTCTSDGAPGTPLSANVTGGWIAWSVQDTSGVDVTGSAADSGITQPIVAPSVTATVAGTLLLNGYMGYKPASSPTITLPASQTGTDVGPVALTSGQLRGGSEELTASGATGTRSASVSTTVRWVGGSVVFKP